MLNLVVQELVKRTPVNIRPLLLVEERRNFKGIALFAMANMIAADLTGETVYRESARYLVEWLLDASLEGYHGFCGGHRHEIQTLDGVVSVDTPGIVGTSYAVKSLLRADKCFDDDYASIARSASEFLFEDLDYETVDDGARIDYKPGDPDDQYTLNAIALGARTLTDLYERFSVPRFRTGATALLCYVAAHQTDMGGWYYREPPSASHLSMDSHHNGFIVEAFQRYASVFGPDRFEQTLEDAIEFYRGLFEADGAPRFDEENAYPRDIHAATQGILVFAYNGEFGRADRILGWTVDTLHAGNGKFYYKKNRFYTNRVVLMRWCQAWMAYALAEFLRCRELSTGTDPRQMMRYSTARRDD